MKKVVTWNLYTNNTLISKKDVGVIYTPNKAIMYKDKDEVNKYDFENQIFTRKTEDFTMYIDFNKSTCEFIFKKEGNCTIDIKCNSIITEKEVILEYMIAEDKIKILINL